LTTKSRAATAERKRKQDGERRDQLRVSDLNARLREFLRTSSGFDGNSDSGRFRKLKQRKAEEEGVREERAIPKRRKIEARNSLAAAGVG